MTAATIRAQSRERIADRSRIQRLTPMSHDGPTPQPAIHRDRALRLAGLAIAIATASGGCTRPWTVVERSAPNRLVGQGAFVLDHVSFEGMRVDLQRAMPEDEYLSTKTASQRSEWQFEKANLEAHFFAALRTRGTGMRFVQPTSPLAESAFVVHTRVTMIEPGSYFRDPECHLDVTIADARGATVDHIVLRVSPSMGVIYPVSTKLERMGDLLGESLARYLRMRIEDRG
jgi:hypothetical protein